MVGVFLRCIRVDENVVQVNDDEMVQKDAKDIVHKRLEGCWSVGKSKGHDKGFKVSIAGSEGCFPFISFFDSEQVVCSA